ncbi:hypothetical protein HID58_007631, partial [Brassica napus]
FYQTKFYNLRSPKTIDGHEIVSNLRQVSGCFICKRRWIMGVIVISMGPSVLELYLCLIHLWEARTGSKGGALIGLELLIIDEQLNVIISVFIDKDFNPQSTTPIKELTKAGSVTIGKNICLYQARISQVIAKQRPTEGPSSFAL